MCRHFVGRVQGQASSAVVLVCPTEVLSRTELLIGSRCTLL